MLWRAWLAPTPSPSLLRCTETGRGGGGGGELLMGRVLPGNSERGGLHWRVYLAGINGDSIGRPKWRLFLVDQSGDSFWRTKMAGLLGSAIWGLWRAGQFGESPPPPPPPPAPSLCNGEERGRGWGPARPARASQTGTVILLPLTWLT